MIIKSLTLQELVKTGYQQETAFYVGDWELMELACSATRLRSPGIISTSPVTMGITSGGR